MSQHGTESSRKGHDFTPLSRRLRCRGQKSCYFKASRGRSCALQAGCRWFETGIAHQQKPLQHKGFGHPVKIGAPLWTRSPRRFSANFSARSGLDPTRSIAAASPARTARPAWLSDLGSVLRREHGRGWTLDPQSQKVKLTRRLPNGERSSVVLDLPWSSTSSTAVLNQVVTIRQRMAEAAAQLHPPDTGSPSTEESTDWSGLIEDFRKHKTDDTGDLKASTWTRQRPGQLVELLARKSSLSLRDSQGQEGRKRPFSCCRRAACGRTRVEQCSPTCRSRQ